MASKTVHSKYAHLSREALEQLLEKYQNTQKLGLLWEHQELEPDQSLNPDFVVLDLLPELSVSLAPYQNLLAEDGVILVSISEHEHARLELLMEEIFPGMEVANFVWRTRSGAQDEKDWFVSVDHEYVLCYANPGFSFVGSKKALEDYSNPDGDERGVWTSGDLTKAHTFFGRPDTFYPIRNPGNDVWYACDPTTVWRFSTKERAEGKKLRSRTMEELIADGRIDWKPEPNPVVYESEMPL